MRIFATKITQSIDRVTYERCLARMDDAKRKRLLALRDLVAMRQILTSDRFIRFLIMRELGLRDTEISFITNPFGKPSLVGASDFHFNLSHAGEWVVAALDDRPIGIDIEWELRDSSFPFTDIFSLSERELFDRASVGERSTLFFTVWTSKESYAKARGQGVRVSFETFSVLPIPSDGIVCLQDSENGQSWFIRRYSFDPRYPLAVCATHSDFADRVIVLDEGDIFRGILGLGE